jgi:hypothetical protein
MVAALRTAEFVGLAAPLLARPEIAETLAQTLCCVLDSAELVRQFLGAQGLSRMLAGDPQAAAAAAPLARRVAEFLPGAERAAIAADLICAGQVECATELIEVYRLDTRAVLEPHFPRLLTASDVCPQACEFLLGRVDVAALAPVYVTVALALGSKSLPLIAKLLGDGGFRRRLPGAGAVVAAAASDPERCACALALAAGLPPEDLAAAARDSGFLRAVVASIHGAGRDAALALLARMPGDAIAAALQDPAFPIAQAIASPAWSALLVRLPAGALVPLTGDAVFIHAVASAPFGIMRATAARLPSEAVARLAADPALSETLAGAIAGSDRDSALAFLTQLPPAAAAHVAGGAAFLSAAAAAVASGAIAPLCKLPAAVLAVAGANAGFFGAVTGAAAAGGPVREQALALAALLPMEAVARLATDAGFARALVESPAGQALAARHGLRASAAAPVDPAEIRAMLARGEVAEAAGALALTVRDRTSANRVLELLPAFQAHVRHPAVLGLLAAIGRYCGPALLGLSWVVSGVPASLSIDRLRHVEANLAVVAAIAESADIHECDALVRALVLLLRSAECTSAETSELMAVFEKMAHRGPLLGVYQDLLQVAESRNRTAAVRALRALSLQKLPKLDTRYGVRLLAIVQYFLESTDEEERKAAAEALRRWSTMPPYARRIASGELHNALQKAFMGTQRTDTFEELLNVAKECQLKVGPTVAAAADALVRGLKNGEMAAGQRILQLMNEVK